MKEKLSLYIFTDFDGTITFKDIGDEIFKEFGKLQPYNDLLKEGKLDIKDYWVAVCNTLPKDFSEQDIKNYALQTDIDVWFPKFADYCRENDIPLSIISDGFSNYINPILKKHKLNWIPVRSNYLTFEDNEVIPHYPYASESCNCLCASCKRNSMLTQVPIDSIIVYIGDGYSDYCAAEHSDVIFAKKNLASHCVRNKIPHYHFKTFFDVLRIFNDIFPKKRPKIRNQAKQLRFKAFECE